MTRSIQPDQLRLRFFVTYTDTRGLEHTSGVRCLPFSIFEFSADASWIVHYSDGRTYETKPGEVFFVPAGTRHWLTRGGSILKMRTVWSILRIEHLPGEDIFQEMQGGPTLPEPVSDRCRELIMTSLEEQRQKDPLAILEHHQRAFELLRLAYPYCTQKEQSNHSDLARIRPALDYIEANYRRDFDREELARIVNISPPRLHAIFKTATGFAPWQYVVQRRIKAAQELLLSTDKRMEEIAVECGFGSGYYFSRLFTKHVGMSPSNYRKSVTSV